MKFHVNQKSDQQLSISKVFKNYSKSYSKIVRKVLQKFFEKHSKSIQKVSSGEVHPFAFIQKVFKKYLKTIRTVFENYSKSIRNIPMSYNM